jgi:hypothetical protein
MPFEALAWTLIVILAPFLAGALRTRIEHFDSWWLELADWIHAAGIPFLAVIIGSISSRAAGIIPFSFATWTSSMLAATAAFLAGALLQRTLPHPAQTYSTPLDVARFEPRWALFRATAALWIGSFTLSVCAGLLLGALEWALNQRLWERAPVNPAHWSRLFQLAFSSLIFWATRNLWVTAALQLGLILLLQRQPSRASTSASADSPDGRKTSEG